MSYGVSSSRSCQPTPSPKCGRPRLSDRAALTGILLVLKTGIFWEYLSQQLGCGSGMTCWRRLRDWQQADVWQRLHQAMLHRMREYDQIHWERASVDSASVPSPMAAHLPAAIPPIAANSAASTFMR
ncbi:transposase [Noviherbaspirillum sp. DKR-6]|uniref:Transposase n=1 Tax=Noviherbaspirillum pedocola TaxID=2801341 RepID=A0A934T0Q7_9BURK|nr:transposase [Noviherbaspirillum pedocola]